MLLEINIGYVILNNCGSWSDCDYNKRKLRDYKKGVRGRIQALGLEVQGPGGGIG